MWEVYLILRHALTYSWGRKWIPDPFWTGGETLRELQYWGCWTWGHYHMAVIATASLQCPGKRTAVFHWALCLGVWHEKVRKRPNFANQMNRNGHPEAKIALILHGESVWSQLSDFSWIISLAYICGQFDVTEFSQTLCNCRRMKDHWLEEYQPKWVMLVFVSALKCVQIETKRGSGSVLQGRMPPPESVLLLPVSSGGFFCNTGLGSW